jgi:hypothetical protein
LLLKRLDFPIGRTDDFVAGSGEWRLRQAHCAGPSLQGQRRWSKAEPNDKNDMLSSQRRAQLQYFVNRTFSNPAALNSHYQFLTVSNAESSDGYGLSFRARRQSGHAMDVNRAAWLRRTRNALPLSGEEEGCDYALHAYLVEHFVIWGDTPRWQDGLTFLRAHGCDGVMFILGHGDTDDVVEQIAGRLTELGCLPDSKPATRRT